MGFNGAIDTSHFKDSGVAIKEGFLGALEELNTI
jgi:hypothetical protein